MLTGTDISAYQSAIPTGDFCVLKATEGLGYVDAPFASRWETLAKRGTLRGAYCFFHPAEDPRQQADHFVDTVEAAGLRQGDTLWLDHEALSLAAAHRTVLPLETRMRMDTELTVSSRASAAEAFCARVMARTGRVGVYTFLSFAQAGYCAGLAKYPLWIADPSRPEGQPRVPLPWIGWSLHQYSTAGGIDRDVFNGSAADWFALGGVKPAPIPAPQEDDMPYIGQLTTGQGAITPLSWPAGKCSSIGFFADTGLAASGPVELRVAYQYAAGKFVVETDIEVDSSKGKTVVEFGSHAPTVNAVSVQRKDAGTVTVCWDAS